jgi:hypothetical protein
MVASNILTSNRYRPTNDSPGFEHKGRCSQRHSACVAIALLQVSDIFLLVRH